MNPSLKPHSAVTPAFVRTVFAIIIALFVVRNLPWHLDDLDQAKQAFVSYQMLEEDRWLVQNTPRDEIATKPPLQGWISAGLRLTGIGWEFAWRLPAFLAALMIMAQLRRTGTLIHSSCLGGLLAAAAFGLNSYVPRLATLVRTDMFLSALIFFTGWLILEKLRTGDAWTWRSRLAVFTLLLGSMLTKGPIAYAFLVPGMLAYRWFTRHSVLPRHVFSGWTSWLLPLAVFGAWLAFGLQVPEFYDQVIGKEFLGRFTVGASAKHHNLAPGAYTLGLLARTLPWTLLLVGFFCLRTVRAALKHDPVLLWLVCWALGGLLFMEFVPSKRFDRILPVLPPLCLLIPAAANYLPQHWPGRWPFVKTAQVAIIAGLLVATLYSTANMVKAFRRDDRMLVRFGEEVKSKVGAHTNRLAIAHVRDEALAMYCGISRYSRYDDALKRWKEGEIDWLVVGQADFEKHRKEFRDFRVVLTTSADRKKADAYRLLQQTPESARPDIP